MQGQERRKYRLRLDSTRGAGPDRRGRTWARALGRGANDVVDIEVKSDLRVVKRIIFDGVFFLSKQGVRGIEVGEEEGEVGSTD